MPIFDFKCTKCSMEVERIVKFDEVNEQSCLKCNAPMVKAISAPGVVIPDPAHAAGFKARSRGKYKLHG